DNAFRASMQEQEGDTAPFAAYRRDVFVRAGFFDESMDRGEDDEFNYRLRATGGRILLTPAVRSTYDARTRFTSLPKQYWGYGIAKASVLRRHPRRLRARHLVPSALVLALAVGPLCAIDRRFGRFGAVAAAAYGAACTMVAVSIGKKGNWKEAPLL